MRTPTLPETLLLNLLAWAIIIAGAIVVLHLE